MNILKLFAAVQMITQTFGEMLYYHDSESCKEFPSPEDLKGKILISTKPPKEYLEANDAKEKDNGEKGKDSDEDVWGKEPEELISTRSELEKVCNFRYHQTPYSLPFNFA